MARKKRTPLFSKESNKSIPAWSLDKSIAYADPDVWIHSSVRNFYRFISQTDFDSDVTEFINNVQERVRSLVYNVANQVNPNEVIFPNGKTLRDEGPKILAMFDAKELSSQLDTVKREMQKLTNERLVMEINKIMKVVDGHATFRSEPIQDGRIKFRGITQSHNMSSKPVFASTLGHNLAVLLTKEYNPGVVKAYKNKVDKNKDLNEEFVRILGEELTTLIQNQQGDAFNIKIMDIVDPEGNYRRYLQDMQRIIKDMEEWNKKAKMLDNAQAKSLISLQKISNGLDFFQHTAVATLGHAYEGASLIDAHNYLIKNNVSNVKSIKASGTSGDNGINKTDLTLILNDIQQTMLGISIKQTIDFNKTEKVDFTAIKKLLPVESINLYRYFTLNYNIFSFHKQVGWVKKYTLNDTKKDQTYRILKDRNIEDSLFKKYNLLLSNTIGQLVILQMVLGQILVSDKAINQNFLETTPEMGVPYIVLLQKHAFFTYDLLMNLEFLITQGIAVAGFNTHKKTANISSLVSAKNKAYKRLCKAYLNGQAPAPNYEDLLLDSEVVSKLHSVNNTFMGDKNMHASVDLAKMATSLNSKIIHRQN